MTAPMEKLRRLKHMGWDELRVRTSQEVAKRWDFVASQIGVRSPGDVGYDPQSHASGRFFFGPEQVPQILDCLRQRLPDVAEEIVERGKKICQHRFDLLGYEAVDYGTRIDWHLDAVHGKRAPRCQWFRVRYLNFDQVGDAKVTWELSRHQHLVTLAKAYRLTGEARYARELFQQWYDWHEQNPYGMGINWASSLEVAFRSLSWLWVWHLLCDCPVIPQQFPFDLQRALALNGRHIERFLSTYFSPNTHLLGEGVGLFFIGTLCPMLQLARRWQECGWQIILQQAQRQVRPDGMHVEQSMYYHTYALDFFLHARTLASLNQIAIPSSFDETVQKMLEVTSALSATGHLPQFGDDDGGRVFDPGRNRAKHLYDPLTTGAVVYNQSNFKVQAAQLNEELFWLLGTEGARKFSELPLRKEVDTSFALKASGIYVMRSSRPVSYQLAIDAGPQGEGHCGHGHADALSVQLSGSGKPLLIDPGTFTYADPFNERDWFRGTGAHNTVRVDDSSQAEPAGPFKWRGRANAAVDCWVAGKSFDFFAGSHTGYCRPSSPVRHRRFIFHLKSRFWLIRDVLEGTGLHRLEVSWHFEPGSLHLIPGGAMFISDELTSLGLLFTANNTCSKEITQDWYSPTYGKKEPCPTLRVATRTSLPAEFTTMLIPHSEVAAHLGLLRPMESGRSGSSVKAFRYSISHEDDYVFFADDSKSWQVGPWDSDARFLFCSTNADRAVRQFVICGGSYFALSGRRLFDVSKPVKHSEWSRDDHAVLQSAYPVRYESAVPKASYEAARSYRQLDGV